MSKKHCHVKISADSPNVVAEVILRVLANVHPYDEGVIVGVMLQPDISGCEGYWYVRPWQVEVFSRADVRDASMVLLPLTLRRVHRFIGAPQNCIDDVDHTH
jgi:hypothetical protein